MSAPDATDFASDFAAALLAPEAPAHWSAQPGFAVYRNTVHKGCIDALEANFPTVLRLVGADWFRAVATGHVRAHPPRDPCLLRYGDGFADTLDAHAADDLPYLRGVALLDRLWTTAHTAADAATLPADALAGLAPERLPNLRLRPHPAARWQWFDTLPVPSIWSANRRADNTGVDALADLVWGGEGLLLVRPDGDIRWQQASQGECAFLDACARGDTLGDAAIAVLGAHPSIDLAASLARLLHAGAFTHLDGDDA